MSNGARCHLAQLPTALEPLDRLSEDVGGARIWCKRDDVTGLGGAGNKLRKLEFLLADALARDADLVLTSGAVQSNHARLTAAACTRVGLPCEVWLNRRVPDRGSSYESTGNVLLDRLFGARVHLVPGEQDPEESTEARAEQLRRQGHRPYVIPAGGSNALGARGYVECARELLSQAEAPFRTLYVATGSGGTLAGLAAGLGEAGWDGRLVGVSVSGPEPEMRARVELPLSELTERPAAFTIEDRFVGPGYGVPTREGLAAIERIARLEGVLLDPVYTGKAAAALLASATELNGDVVFVHTGGLPSLFAYEKELS